MSNEKLSSLNAVDLLLSDYAYLTPDERSEYRDIVETDLEKLKAIKENYILFLDAKLTTVDFAAKIMSILGTNKEKLL